MSTPTRQHGRSLPRVRGWADGLFGFAASLSSRPRTSLALLIFAVLLARLPFLTKPLAPDEGGYLLVASQWSHGTSLYGDYWVDRPPLLIMIFQLADFAGGQVALRVIGIVSVVVAVLVSAHIGRLVAPQSRHASLASAATAAIFLTNPMFGVNEVNGELLAAPFVLMGVVAVLQATRACTRPPRFAWWFVAGGTAIAAAAIKQSMLDVFAIAGATVFWLVWSRRPGQALQALIGVGVGAVALASLIGWWATSRGTDIAGLWDAVVTFRAQAASVISSSSPSSGNRRAGVLLLAFLGSGAIGLLAGAFAPVPGGATGRRTTVAKSTDGDVLCVVLGALLAWEIFAVAAGGGYWLHYLVGVVPGLVLATGVALRRPRRVRWITLTHVYSIAASAVAVFVVMTPVFTTGHDTSADVGVQRYLDQHARPGDTAMVAFGNPALLQASRMRSPYPDLWSLPVKVRDPQLHHFTNVIGSADQPTWVIVSGPQLGSWGIDASRAQPVLDREYRLVRVIGDYHLYRAT